MDDMLGRIDAKRIKYHRNGVGGAGFFTVEFTFFDDDCNYRDMVATIFPEAEGDMPSHYAVLDIAEPSYRWRGDHFIYALWRAINAAQEDEGTANEIYT
jgi:hypothetical protein